MRRNELLERITLDPRVMVGKPVIKGTRTIREDPDLAGSCIRKLDAGAAPPRAKAMR